MFTCHFSSCLPGTTVKGVPSIIDQAEYRGPLLSNKQSFTASSALGPACPAAGLGLSVTITSDVMRCDYRLLSRIDYRRGGLIALRVSLLWPPIPVLEILLAHLLVHSLSPSPSLSQVVCEA